MYLRVKSEDSSSIRAQAMVTPKRPRKAHSSSSGSVVVPHLCLYALFQLSLDFCTSLLTFPHVKQNRLSIVS